MKIFIKFFIPAILIVLLQGCIEIKTIINVNADGSGTVEETVLLSSEIVNMISQFADTLSEGSASSGQGFSIFNQEELRNDTAKYGSGVKYVSGKSLKQDGKEGYKAIYSFADISRLIIDQNPQDKISMGEGGEETVEEKEPIKFAFLKGPPPVVTINLPGLQDLNDSTKLMNDSSSFDTASADSNSFNEIMGMMQDLKISTILKVNGTVLESNATYIDGSTVTLLNINFGELMKNMENINELKKMNIQNVQQVKDIMKTLKGIQMETNSPVSIIFKEQ